VKKWAGTRLDRGPWSDRPFLIWVVSIKFVGRLLSASTCIFRFARASIINCSCFCRVVFLLYLEMKAGDTNQPKFRSHLAVGKAGRPFLTCATDALRVRIGSGRVLVLGDGLGTGADGAALEGR